MYNGKNEQVKHLVKTLQSNEYDPSYIPEDIDMSKLEERAMQVLEDEDGTPVKYQGQWIVGTKVKQGRGNLYWPNGSRYEGWWVNDKYHYKGRMVSVH